MLMREIRCPFCTHIIVTHACVNALCLCGAKYYIHNGEFWDRKDGKIVKGVSFRLFNIKED